MAANSESSKMMESHKTSSNSIMQNCRLGITTMSLGYASAGHDFFHKLEMARKYGYEGIELFWGDLEDVAGKLKERFPNSQYLEAAGLIEQACSRLDLEVICLQPFSQYEGLIDRNQHTTRIEQLKLWLLLANILRTKMILIPANFLPADQLSDTAELAITDLREAADLGMIQRPPIKFAYEALCWSTHCDTWERTWEIVQAVDRPNFGICLDTFNIAGRVYADPTSFNGCNLYAEKRMQESIKRMTSILNKEKVFFVQVVDAERLNQPLTPAHPFWIKDLPPRMSWSRSCRLFYGEREQGAYLPIFEICRAIFSDLKFQGWVSFELFNRKMHDQDKGVPEELAKRGSKAWQRLIADMNTV